MESSSSAAELMHLADESGLAAVKWGFVLFFSETENLAAA